MATVINNLWTRVSSNFSSVPPQQALPKQERLELVKHQDEEDEEDEFENVLVEEVDSQQQLPQSLWGNVSSTFSSVRNNVATRLGYAPVAPATKQNLNYSSAKKKKAKPPAPAASSDEVVIEVAPEEQQSGQNSYVSSLSSWAQDTLNNVKTTLGIEPEPPRPTTWYEKIAYEFNNLFSLSTKQRMYGFIICFVTGLLCIGFSLFLLPYILVPYAGLAFGLLFTIGSIALFTSSFFVVGPTRQLKLMCTVERIIPTLMYIISLLLTLIVVIKLQSFILVFMLIIVQIIAFAWYVLTYIPFGSTVASTTLRTVLFSAFQ